MNINTQVNSNVLDRVIPAHIEAKDIVFLCIGTDRSTGDSLGPIVGTNLKRLGYKVYGTLDHPVHAMNLAETRERIPDSSFIIAIDSALASDISRIGVVQIKPGSLEPGAGVGKDIPPVGDVSIRGAVNLGGFMEFLVLQNTRLSVVMSMAFEITQTVHTFMIRRYSHDIGHIIRREKARNRNIPALPLIREVDLRAITR